jgi:hypothetical protein
MHSYSGFVNCACGELSVTPLLAIIAIQIVLHIETQFIATIYNKKENWHSHSFAACKN